MQHVALAFYLLCLIVGLSSLINAALVALRTRSSLFLHYLGFSLSYTLLIATFLASLYLEVNQTELFAAVRVYIRLVLFFTQCSLVCTLAFFLHHVFGVRAGNAINLTVCIVILVLGIARLVFFLDVIPEDVHTAPALPILRLVLGGLIVAELLYVLVLRLFRIHSIVLREFQGLIRTVSLLLVLFAPGVILEVIFHARWGFVLFTPAMYGVVSLAFMVEISRHFYRRYRPTDGDLNRLLDGGRAALDDFAQKHRISTREMDVIAHLVRGRTNRQIAESLFISPSTVKAHIYTIFRKTEVKTRYALLYKVLNGD